MTVSGPVRSPEEDLIEARRRLLRQPEIRAATKALALARVDAATIEDPRQRGIAWGRYWMRADELARSVDGHLTAAELDSFAESWAPHVRLAALGYEITAVRESDLERRRRQRTRRMSEAQMVLAIRALALSTEPERREYNAHRDCELQASPNRLADDELGYSDGAARQARKRLRDRRV